MPVCYFADFAKPITSYWKASNNYTVDQSIVIYRIYGPDVQNPPSAALIKAAETVMKAMYENYCNISATLLEAKDTPSAKQIIHNDSEFLAHLPPSPTEVLGLGRCFTEAASPCSEGVMFTGTLGVLSCSGCMQSTSISCFLVI